MEERHQIYSNSARHQEERSKKSEAGMAASSNVTDEDDMVKQQAVQIGANWCCAPVVRSDIAQLGCRACLLSLTCNVAASALHRC